jgi:hypothetical protein
MVDIVLHITGHRCIVGNMIIFHVKVFMSDLDFSLTLYLLLIKGFCIKMSSACLILLFLLCCTSRMHAYSV